MNERMLAIEPETYRRWAREIYGRSDLGQIRDGLHRPEAAERLQPSRKNVGAIAVVSLSGYITQKPSIWSEFFGGTSTEALITELREFVQDETVGSVVLNVDSPGGSVFGLAEAAPAIRALRGVKPIVAVANPIMASAAYYLAAQADEIVATPSALVGSIGTMAFVIDPTEALTKAGIKIEVFTYGERKAEMMPPLDDEARQAIQAEVDYFGGMFEADVARGRGISRAAVRERYGRGAVFNAKPALEVGLVDRVGTLEDVIVDLARGHRAKPLRVTSQSDPVESKARAALAGLTGLRSSG